MLPDLFKVFEKDLIEKIRNSESPFLGLFEDFFKDATRKYLISCIQRSFNPLQEYLDSLNQFPALLSTLLVVQLLEDFGEEGHFAVYPVIKKIFGEEPTQAERVKLWREFRRACLLKLGLSVSSRTSGTHYMVIEYLRQAGLPLRFVEKYTEKAIYYANQTGIPDMDDPESIKLWQIGLIDHLKPPFPETARKAIEADEDCYYSLQFIQLFSNPNIDQQSLSRLQKLILKAIIDGPQGRTIKRAAIPQIVLRELEYGVLLPGGNRTKWKIIIDDDTHAHKSQADDRFIPFETLLPSSVLIKHENGAKWEFKLWEDEKNNRLLLFSLPSGKFIKKSSLAKDKIFLEPGEYVLLMRFKPEDDEGLEVFSEAPSLYLKKIRLSYGQKITLQRGPAELVFEADDIPVLNIIGEPLRGVRGNELFPAKGLHIEAVIPDEMIDAEISFYLQLKSSALGSSLTISLPEKKNGNFLTDIGKVIHDWKPGVHRVLFELYRHDTKRPVVRNSIVIWNGLYNVKHRTFFYCHDLPNNLHKEGCENIKIDKEKKLITYQNETNRFFKMAFDDGNRKLYFTWAVPGIFLSIFSYSGHEEVERLIRLGETISITSTTRKVLVIYSTEPALLRFGDFSINVDFSRIGSKRIPLASLIEYLGPNENTLELLRNAYSEPIKLVRLVSPFEVVQYQTEKGMGIKKIHFEVASEIQAIRVSAHNLLNGNKLNVEFVTGNIGEDIRGQLMPEIIIKIFIVTNKSCDIYYSISNWPAGFWILQIQIKANGRWGFLTNAKNHYYAEGIVVSSEPNARKTDEVYSVFMATHDLSLLPGIFGRIHRALLTPYAKECWEESLYWLEKFWRKISSHMIYYEYDDHLACQLLELSTERHQDAFMDFQIPINNLAAALPKMFCLEKCQYSEKIVGINSLLSCLRFFPKISEPYSLFSESIVDPAVIFGFENAIEVVKKHEKPRKFNIESYKIAIKQRDVNDRWRLLNDYQWVPARGDFLGPMHYRYALNRFQDNFKNNINITIESNRRGRALFLVKRMRKSTIADYFKNNKYQVIKGNIDLGLFDYNEFQPELLCDESAMTREYQLNIIHFLSLFAQVCRCEARDSEVMDKFCSTIISKCKYSYKDYNKSLGYLLSIGEDLFAYYLFLWELVFTADCDQPRRIYVRS